MSTLVSLMAHIPNHCGSCRHWEQHDDEFWGYCKRFPPQYTPSDVPAIEGRRVARVWARPLETLYADGCHEWETRTPETLDTVAVQLAKATLAGDMTAARALADRLQEIVSATEPAAE